VRSRNFLAIATVASSAALLSSCGYRIVRNSDVTARRFVQDSATIRSLEQQLIALRASCRADSMRLEGEIAAQRAAAAVTPPPAPAPDSLLKARIAEIAALKDQLSKVSAELDRIKRRLANPRG
jgi:hypothetical protein